MSDIGPRDWPLDPADVDEELEELRSRARSAILSVDDEGAATVVTEDGAAPVWPPEHPGGWAELGYDDGPDSAEVTR